MSAGAPQFPADQSSALDDVDSAIRDVEDVLIVVDAAISSDKADAALIQGSVAAVLILARDRCEAARRDLNALRQRGAP